MYSQYPFTLPAAVSTAASSSTPSTSHHHAAPVPGYTAVTTAYYDCSTTAGTQGGYFGAGPFQTSCTSAGSGGQGCYEPGVEDVKLVNGGGGASIMGKRRSVLANFSGLERCLLQ